MNNMNPSVATGNPADPNNHLPKANNNGISLEALGTVSGQTLAITIVCGVLRNHFNVHKPAIFYITIILCALVVFIWRQVRTDTVRKEQYWAAMVFNIFFLFMSVAGATGASSEVLGPGNSGKDSSDNKSLKKVDKLKETVNYRNSKQQYSSVGNFFISLLPSEPLFGVSEKRFQDTVQVVDSQKSILDKLNIQNAPVDTNKNSQLSSVQFTRPIGDTFWVYLGQKFRTEWKPKNFAFDLIPQQHTRLGALTDVYQRADLPREISTDVWQLGKINGVVKQNDTVTVLRVEEIETANYWALVFRDTATTHIHTEYIQKKHR